jgi:hypothetical protein
MSDTSLPSTSSKDQLPVANKTVNPAAADKENVQNKEKMENNSHDDDDNDNVEALRGFELPNVPAEIKRVSSLAHLKLSDQSYLEGGPVALTDWKSATTTANMPTLTAQYIRTIHQDHTTRTLQKFQRARRLSDEQSGSSKKARMTESSKEQLSLQRSDRGFSQAGPLRSVLYQDEEEELMPLRIGSMPTFHVPAQLLVNMCECVLAYSYSTDNFLMVASRS